MVVCYDRKFLTIEIIHERCYGPTTPHKSSSYAVSEIQTEFKKREVNATVNQTS